MGQISAVPAMQTAASASHTQPIAVDVSASGRFASGA
jgi:hypothetical protein